MKNLIYLPRRKLEAFFSCIGQSYSWCLSRSLHLLFFANPFFIELFYFTLVSLLGYTVLRFPKPRTSPSFIPKDIDVFFTSVSATTVSSMSSVDMEVFSNTQLLVITILMLVGGEVFTSMLGLQFAKSKFLDKLVQGKRNKVDFEVDSNKTDFGQVELVVVSLSRSDSVRSDSGYAKDNAIKCLAYVVLVYLVVVHVGGSILISIYINLVPSAREVLKSKGIATQTFAIFATVSTFANCGFIPTNENMVIFKNNSGLLLLLIPQALFGNTLYPVILRFLIWVLEKVTRKVEFGYMLNNFKELGYKYLLSGRHSVLLLATVLGFIIVQMILFCAMEWKSEAMDGLSGYQKFVGSLFQTVNTRHSGEYIVDLSILSPAILVLFVFMMYLPPHTTFLPAIGDSEESEPSENGNFGNRGKTVNLMESLLFSQVSYLAIFVILICITEGKKMKEDPLNFNVLNITIEVISAYGNVGFSSGYSCKRRLNSDGDCKDAGYGFAGRWSTEGKCILILVMFYGRLKKFSLKQGKAWKLS